ncbi:MAG TPA: hypothetical protein VF070_00600 [Streptosporangiaceae bacterium]
MSTDKPSRPDEPERSDLTTAPATEGVYPGADDDAIGEPMDFTFKYKPDVMHIEGPPVDSEGKLIPPLTDQQKAEQKQFDTTTDRYEPVSPADAALVRQGMLENYAGSDEWRSGMRSEGDRIWFGAVDPHPPDASSGYLDKGISGFGVPEGELPDDWGVALSARTYSEGTQVMPGGPDNTYRGWLQCYEFTKDCAVAEGVARENTQYGGGGTPQVYVPDIEQAVHDGVLKYAGQVQMTDTQPDWDRMTRP